MSDFMNEANQEVDLMNFSFLWSAYILKIGEIEYFGLIKDTFCVFLRKTLKQKNFIL